MAMWDGKVPYRQRKADVENMNLYLNITDRNDATPLFSVVAADADKVIEQMNEQQKEVPEWAKGEGWTWDKTSADYLSNSVDIAILKDGSLFLGGTCREDNVYCLKYATPEIAREVADFILARVVK